MGRSGIATEVAAAAGALEGGGEGGAWEGGAAAPDDEDASCLLSQATEASKIRRRAHAAIRMRLD